MNIKEITSGKILFWPVDRQKTIAEGREFDIHSCSMGIFDRTTPNSGMVKSLVLRQGELFQRTSLFDALTGQSTSTEKPTDLPEPRHLSLPGIRLTRSWTIENDTVADN